MEGYELYCLADRRFYETPTNRGAEHPDFALCARPVPDGWDHIPGDTWMHYAPSDRRLALADDQGRLVPDHRGPTFSTPPWVRLPSFLESHLEARSSVTTSELAYTIEGVIQFSNGGC